MHLLKGNKSNFATICIKALEYTLFSVMMAITLAAIVRTEFEAIKNFNIIWLTSIALYFFSAFVNHKFARHNPFFLIVISIGAIFGSMLLILGRTFYFFEMPLFVSFVLVWAKGTNLEINSEKIETLRSRILFGLIFLVLAYFVLFKSKLAGEYTLISHYYIPFYGVLGFMMLNLVNMHSAYASGHFKINENKNVDRFSKIALTVSVVVLLFIQFSLFDISHVIKEGLSILYDVLFRIISILLFPVLWLIEILLESIKSKFASEELDKMTGTFTPNKTQLPNQEGVIITPGMETIFTVLTWSVLILIGTLILWKIYQQIAVKKKPSVSTGDEAREFVFSLKDAYREMFNRSNKTITSDKLPKHPTRRAYRDALIELRSKGIDKPGCFTPSEYFSKIINTTDQLTSEEKNKLETLTQNYQKIRFGSDEK